MNNLSDKISYLRGLAEGLKIDQDSNEGKLILQLIDVMQDAVAEISEMQEAMDELNDYVESIDDDLSELEGDFEDDDEFNDDDDIFDSDTDMDDNDDAVLDFFPKEAQPDEEDGVGMYVGCICPSCHGMFCVDAYEDEENQMYVCPHCDSTVEARPMDNDNVPIAKAFSEEPEDV